MLSNAEELNVYLQCAFDHFSHDLDTPFNFMDAGFKISAVPLDLGGNIWKLAVAIKKSGRFTDPRNIFKELSWFVASCISLDIVRQGLKGKPLSLTPSDVALLIYIVRSGRADTAELLLGPLRQCTG
jgi:hypothetical protein